MKTPRAPQESRPDEEPEPKPGDSPSEELLQNCEPECDLELDTVDDDARYLDWDESHRKWLRCLLPLVQSRNRDSDPSDRVQLALDKMVIAVTERVGRICRSDLPDERA